MQSKTNFNPGKPVAIAALTEDMLEWARYSPVTLSPAGRDKLLENGYEPIPVRGKATYVSGWTEGDVDKLRLKEWRLKHPDHIGTGLRTGTVKGVDLDVTDEAALRIIVATMLAVIGSDPLCKHGSKGLTAFYCTSEPAPKIVLPFTGPDGMEHKIEVLGLKNQTACYGTVKPEDNNGKPEFTYLWLDGRSPLDTPVQELPMATADSISEFLTTVGAKLTAAGYTVGDITRTRRRDKEERKPSAYEDTPVIIDSALAWLKDRSGAVQGGNNGPKGVGGDQWTYETACWLMDQAVSEAVTLELMLDHWNDKCDPMWSPRDLEKKVRSAANHRQNGTANKLPLTELGDTEDSIISDRLRKEAGLPAKSMAVAPESENFMDLLDPWQEYYAPRFPMDVLPPPLRRFVTSKSKEIGVDPAAVAMSSLAALSGALSHAVKLEIRPGFVVAGRIWTLLVGSPSSKKSPAMKAAMAPLHKLDVRARKDHAASVARLKASNADKKDIDAAEAATPRQHIINDVTVEKYGEIASRQNTGALLWQDELATWIGGIDRYKTGKGASSDRGMWLMAYDGGPYNIQRVGRKTTPIENNSVSILGGIQPARLRELGELSSDGLIQRFLPVMMRKSAIGSEDFDAKGQGEYERLIERLASIVVEEFEVKTSREAKAEFRRLETTLHELATNESASDSMSSFIGKLTGLWGSLALILHMAWGNDLTAPVSLQTACMASKLIEDFILPHGFKFYDSLVDDMESDLRAMAAFVVEHYNRQKGKGADDVIVASRDFARGPTCCRVDAPDYTRFIINKVHPLVAGGWLDPEDDGWRCTRWAINPAVVRFAKRVEVYRKTWTDIRAKFKPDAENPPEETGYEVFPVGGEADLGDPTGPSDNATGYGDEDFG